MCLCSTGSNEVFKYRLPSFRTLNPGGEFPGDNGSEQTVEEETNEGELPPWQASQEQ